MTLSAKPSRDTGAGAQAAEPAPPRTHGSPAPHSGAEVRAEGSAINQADTPAGGLTAGAPERTLDRTPDRALDKAPDRPVSLATLSAHLGLSQAAISRVLNRVPAAKAIPKSTQDRIFAAAREFRYRPNVLARSLRSGQSMTIGVLVPEISEGYATLVLAGLEQGLLRAGYAFFLCSHHHHPEVVDSSQTMLVERAVDGIVAIDTTLTQHGLLPTVTVSCPDLAGAAIDIVLDHTRGAEAALEHLHALGHRRLAVIKGQSFSSDTEPRWEAIHAAAARLGLAIDPRAVTSLEGDAPTHEPGYLATRRLLAAGVPFTALFAFNDVSAIGAVRGLREAGLRVPEDVSVVGFDDVQSAAFQNPALTTVRQPLHAMGLLAAEEIVREIGRLNRAGGADGAGRRLVVKPALVVRESTGPASCRTAAAGTGSNMGETARQTSPAPEQDVPAAARRRAIRPADPSAPIVPNPLTPKAVTPQPVTPQPAAVARPVPEAAPQP